MTNSSKQNVYLELARYYASVAEQLTSEGRQASLLENTTAVGTDREEIYRRFLERHLPSACEVVRGGYLFDLNGIPSKQIDVMVTAGVAPRFQMASANQAIAPLEGAVAVVEVKSKLDKGELHRALENIASVPTLPNPNKALNPQVAGSVPYWTRDWPYKIVFAFDADTGVATMMEHLNRYIEDNDIPHERRPSIIHVLGKYFIVRIKPGHLVENIDQSLVDSQPQEWSYHTFDWEPDVQALAHILPQIQRNAFLAGQMIWDYDTHGNRVIQQIRKISSQGKDFRKPW